MFFLWFLFLGAIVWILGLLLIRGVRQRASFYSALSLLLLFTGLILFTLLSWWASIVPLKFGDGALITYSVSFPEGYLERGVVGIAVLLVGLLGVVSPALAAWLTSRQPSGPATVR